MPSGAAAGALRSRRRTGRMGAVMTLVSGHHLSVRTGLGGSRSFWVARLPRFWPGLCVRGGALCRRPTCPCVCARATESGGGASLHPFQSTAKAAPPPHDAPVPLSPWPPPPPTDPGRRGDEPGPAAPRPATSYIVGDLHGRRTFGTDARTDRRRISAARGSARSKLVWSWATTSTMAGRAWAFWRGMRELTRDFSRERHLPHGQSRAHDARFSE